MDLTAGMAETTDEWADVTFPGVDATDSPVLITTITTFHGDNPAEVRLRDLSADSMKAQIEEETTADPETGHVREMIEFVGAEPGLIHAADGSVIGEAGTTELDQPGEEHWHTISLSDRYDNPVVFTQILTYRGTDPCHGRVRNVNSDRFEFQIEEWQATNAEHVKEKIGYIVLEEGEHRLAGGAPIEVQTVSTNHTWTNVPFRSNFGREPAVVSQCQTVNGPHQVVTRHRNLQSSGIEVRLQESEARSGEHVRESIGILAMPRLDVDVAFGRVEDVDHQWKAFTFESRIDDSPVVLTTIDTFNGRNPATPQLRNVSPTGAEIRVEEETSADSETRHNPETIGVIAFPSGPIRDRTGDRIGEAGTLQTDQPGRSHWHMLNFEGSYSDPVVFMEIMTFNGKHPSHIRLRKNSPSSCEFQIEEWSYLDGSHNEETIGYVVIESGTHDLLDGARLHVGTTQTDHNWSHEVSFAPDYKNKQPIMIAQSQTQNGTHEIITRVRDLDAHGFKVRVQEEQGRDGQHNVETIAFMGLARPDRQVPTYQTDRVLDVRVSNFDVKTCGFRFANSGFSGGYTLPQPIKLPGPIPDITEIGDTSNGMCGGMVYAVRDYYECNFLPWSDELMRRQPNNSPTSNDPPSEDTKLFDYLAERLFDSFTPASGNVLGAALYQTLMNSPNTEKWGQVKKSRNQVMKEQWENTIKPTLDNNHPCPLGLIHVDTHGKPFKTGLNQLGDNHQVLAYGYSKSGQIIEIYVYDPNYPNGETMRIQFEKKGDLSNWFNPQYIGSPDPLYAFFAPAYSVKQPPTSF